MKCLITHATDYCLTVTLTEIDGVAHLLLGGLAILFPSCKFPIVRVWQKLCKLVESGQSYYNNKRVQFSAHPVVYRSYFLQSWCIHYYEYDTKRNCDLHLNNSW